MKAKAVMMKFTRTIISSYKCRSWWFSRSSFITAHQRIMKRMVIKSDSWQLVLSLLLWMFALFFLHGLSKMQQPRRPRQGNSQLWRVQLPMFCPCRLLLRWWTCELLHSKSPSSPRSETCMDSNLGGAAWINHSTSFFYCCLAANLTC